MPKTQVASAGDEGWARFRFSIIGPLLAAPPEVGGLKEELQRLAEKKWRHPVTGEWTDFGYSSIERWYYQAANATDDPVAALSRKIREDRGTHPSLSQAMRDQLAGQYKAHPGWTYQLHSDNLAAWIKQKTGRRPTPSYGSVLRYMKAHGWLKRPRRGRGNTAGSRAAEKRFEEREIRSYESEYVHALWHLDFHSGSLRVLCPDGTWRHPRLLAVLDDHSRLCGHAQWYLAENAENLVHGLSQAFLKRGLPRALMSDNGRAMIADETTQGLLRLGVFHELTLPYSPYQNGKQEVLWAQVEGRLMAMLEGRKNLTLAQLNECTLAWVEMGYNRRKHSELGTTPLARFLEAKDVGRASPSAEDLQKAFTTQIGRKQRRGDGTVTVEGIRFEVPSRYRHLERMTLRYAFWDLGRVYLSDARTGRILCRLYPQDKHKNADARRRLKGPVSSAVGGDLFQAPDADGLPPLLRQIIADYAATGLPPAYLPKDELPENANPKDPTPEDEIPEEKDRINE